MAGTGATPEGEAPVVPKGMSCSSCCSPGALFSVAQLAGKGSRRQLINGIEEVHKAPALPSRRRLRFLARWARFRLSQLEFRHRTGPPSPELQRPIVDHVIAAAAPWAERLTGSEHFPAAVTLEEEKACLEALRTILKFLKVEGIAQIVRATNELSEEEWREPPPPPGTATPEEKAAERQLLRWHSAVLPVLAALSSVDPTDATGLAKWSAEFMAENPTRAQPSRFALFQSVRSFSLVGAGLPRASSKESQTTRRLDSFKSCCSDMSELELPPEDEENRHDDLTEDDEATKAMAELDSFLSVKTAQSERGVLSWLGMAAAPALDEWEFKRGSEEHGWDSADSSSVKVRGPNFLTDRKKEAGGAAMFETVHVDLFLVTEPKGVEHISTHPGSVVQELRRAGEKRFLFVVNWRMPPMQLACVFAAPENWLSNQAEDSPAEALAKSFCEDMEDAERSSHFKVIPYVCEGPWLVQKAVGRTPAIIGKKLSMDYFHEPGDHFEVSVDIFSSSAAQRVFGLLQGAAKVLSMEVYFVLEGRTQEQLPEQVLGAFRVSHADLARQRGPI